MSITVSIETAKKLKEKGYLQTTEFSWIYKQVMDDKYWKIEWGNNYADNEYISAPTAQELMESMPDHISDYDNIYDLTTIRFNDGYVVTYGHPRNGHNLITFDGNSLCECLVKLWIWCKDEGYIE